MSHEQLGIYMRLLCVQHQSGGLIEKESFKAMVGTHDIVKSKFIETDEGFFNERMMREMNKRQVKSSNLSANAKKSWENRCKSKANASDLHKPIESENESNTTIQQIKEVFAFFCITLNKKILLSRERERIIKNRLQEGRTVKELEHAITNFSKDDWPDRHKYCDIVYCLGVRNKVDNLDKWLVGKSTMAPLAAKHPKDCPDCWGTGLETAIGSGKQTPCRRRYV